MTKDEIIAGLRNAMERGQSLNRAARSFINAGYNPVEVSAAVQEISSYGGASGIVQIGASPEEMKSKETKISERVEAVEQKNFQQPTQLNQMQPMQAPSSQKGMQQVRIQPRYERSSSRGKIILIISVILSLFIFLGSLGFLIYTLLTR